MKTRILSLITLTLVVLGLTKTTYAANLNGIDYTLLNGISAINKIEIHGNVELYISDAPTDQVKVYNKYYSESALVQSKNGILSIASYKNEKLIVWVSANDLRSISAYDNAEVKSFGNLSKIEFNVDLHDSATAKINLDAYTANVTVKDNAKASLTGFANEFNVNGAANITRNNFAVVRYNESKTVLATETKTDDLAGL